MPNEKVYGRLQKNGATPIHSTTCIVCGQFNNFYEEDCKEDKDHSLCCHNCNSVVLEIKKN